MPDMRLDNRGPLIATAAFLLQLGVIVSVITAKFGTLEGRLNTLTVSMSGRTTALEQLVHARTEDRFRATEAAALERQFRAELQVRDEKLLRLEHEIANRPPDWLKRDVEELKAAVRELQAPGGAYP